jgi:hypothetical protein
MFQTCKIKLQIQTWRKGLQMQNVDTHDMALCKKKLTNQGLCTKTTCRLLIEPSTHSKSTFSNLYVHTHNTFQPNF